MLTATASVNAGQVNTISLAIADALDHVLDTVVFIQAGSLSTTPPVTSVPAPSTLALAMLGLAAVGLYVGLRWRARA